MKMTKQEIAEKVEQNINQADSLLNEAGDLKRIAEKCMNGKLAYCIYYSTDSEMWQLELYNTGGNYSLGTWEIIGGTSFGTYDEVMDYLQYHKENLLDSGEI